MTTLLKEEQIVLEKIYVPGFHKVVRARKASAGLDALIAMHDIRLGKALGGTRIYPYKSLDEALIDVKRLAQGMTHKAAASQTGWGGGKSVIIADPKKDKSEKLLHAFGEAVNLLKGEYICAEDAGCTPNDLSIVAEKTPYVVGLPHEKSSGNPSPFTAWGVFRGIQAVLKQIYDSNDVSGKIIAIQGLGSVGSRLAEILFWHGAKLIITDLNMDRAEALAKQFGGKAVRPEEIYGQPCDVFSPCAFGGIINVTNLEKLRCRSIAGAANNQLLNDSDAEELRRLGILYAPDFVINGGGLINVTEETTKEGYNPFISRNKVDRIYDLLRLIFDIASQNGISTLKAVMELVNYRLQYGIGKRAQPIYMHHAGISY